MYSLIHLFYAASGGEWNPKRLKKVPIELHDASYSPDGKYLVTMPFYTTPLKFGIIRIYDVNTWAYKEIQAEHLETIRAKHVTWTADGRIMAVGIWDGGNFKDIKEGKPAIKDSNGRALKLSDIVAMLIDPNNKIPSRLQYLVANTLTPKTGPFNYENDFVGSVGYIVGDKTLNKVAVFGGSIFDVSTLSLHQFTTWAEIKAQKFPLAQSHDQIAFSPDGKLLFISSSSVDKAPHVVVDTQTYKTLLQFDNRHTKHGGSQCLAVSPNGKQLAVCDHKSVNFFHIKQ